MARVNDKTYPLNLYKNTTTAVLKLINSVLSFSNTVNLLSLMLKIKNDVINNTKIICDDDATFLVVVVKLLVTLRNRGAIQRLK
jgi:hypothetical protein